MSHTVSIMYPRYRWEEVAAAIEQQILDGTLPVGARLPGERDLATEHGVAVVTARRAVAELRDQGILATLRGRGTFVVREPEGS